MLAARCAIGRKLQQLNKPKQRIEKKNFAESQATSPSFFFRISLCPSHNFTLVSFDRKSDHTYIEIYTKKMKNNYLMFSVNGFVRNLFICVCIGTQYATYLFRLYIIAAIPQQKKKKKNRVFLFFLHHCYCAAIACI